MYNKSCMVKINKSTVMDFIIPVTVNGCGHGDMVAVIVKRGMAVMETCPVMVKWSARKLRCDIAAAWSVGMSASIYAWLPFSFSPFLPPSSSSWLRSSWLRSSVSGGLAEASEIDILEKDELD